MNRTLVIGGLVALAVLLGLASWLLIGGRKPAPTSTEETVAQDGPMALNQVSIITKTGTTPSADNRSLNVLFSDFELRGSGREVRTAVFSTTWHVKLEPGERVAVATATVKGFMSSSGAQPQPPAAPPPATTPADAPATPADASASSATPATTAPPPAPVAPPRPVAGAGIATIFITVDGNTSSTQWRDTNGGGTDRVQTQAAVFSDAAHEKRNGGDIPVTVMVELNSNGSTESVAKISQLDLRLFVDNVPEPEPAPAPAAGTTAPSDTTAPAPANN
ncbi:MAG: hypothetical protein GC190_08325 [Alphaproteobacteria bacterium]|nr:hypothetical protein [Alphaproteobacteria bacterium]